MLTGYNTDIKHEGVVYHVQTEDGGTENPVIVSLVYQGGRILVSKKTSYAQLLGTESFLPQLRDLLERQHKTMIKAILTGNLPVGSPGADDRSPAQAPGAVPTTDPVPVSEGGSPSVPGQPVPRQPVPPPTNKPPLEVPKQQAERSSTGSSAEKNLDQVILEYLASEIDND